ncbi:MULTISPECIES: hypothetical protein [unclassified Martelella]|uniref:alginate O-acetyltransferase AlgX-related protein n=1 Tax=unclassified Martelella TaxID=2629616 RepID=UPI0025BA0DE5|nr:hypothetical protein [Martelella sp.]|tara:strand:+ start:1706 stop:2752 length:1047 start_codon:yes stop_codon:yes gene_type:complete
MDSMKTIAALCVAAGLGCGIAQAEEAQSLYGCANLAEKGEPQALEGKDGYFFTVMGDIAMKSVADPALAESVAAFSKLLKAHGTILIFVPLPTRSQVLADKVPQAAWLYGYKENINTEIYQEAIKRLNDAGVVTVDLLTPMKAKAADDSPVYQKADPLWTTEGARFAAEAIAGKITAMPQSRKANLMTFTTTKGEDYTRRSDLREAIQAHCSESLPPVTEARYETVGEEAFAADRPFNILGADAPAPVVLVGSRFSAEGQSHFDGFLKQFSSMDVDNRASASGNPFKSITDYLRSGDLQAKPPLFLVWEVPPGGNLASYGPEPWETLEASAAGDCGPDGCGAAAKGSE